MRQAAEARKTMQELARLFPGCFHANGRAIVASANFPRLTPKAAALVTMTITTEQRDILRHSLGLGRGSREYRNHFVTGPGSSDYANCEDLVGAGLMTKRPGHALSGGDPVYIVTEAGKMAARRETPDGQFTGCPQGSPSATAGSTSRTRNTT